ncbi:hypothetical protein Acr_20g0008590 [Actinidia rufa]|uniref:Uncharacterized protein n=1 Tax=Actinidia rufa TaxID=165716 RepID=A0A7J0GE66_9ERIC|nr:hypothetical protein Acr_20g0008390 [Actinidia rufa]GFZ09051.1 hypothetical protein Acr_20g0008590 [Actinidia rufa]
MTKAEEILRFREEAVEGETTALWPLVDEAREKSMELGLPTKAEKRVALREGAENTVGGDVAGSNGLEGGGGDSSSF